MEPTPMQTLQALLEEEGYAVHHTPADEETVLERLSVLAGVDAEGEARILEMCFLTDAMDNMGLMREEDTPDLMQFFVMLCEGLPAGRRDEAGRFALTVSPLLPLGSLGLSAEGVFYRYVLPCMDRLPEPEVLLETVAIAETFAELLPPWIRKISEGATVEDLLPEMAEAGMVLPEAIKVSEPSLS